MTACLHLRASSSFHFVHKDSNMWWICSQYKDKKIYKNINFCIPTFCDVWCSIVHIFKLIFGCIIIFSTCRCVCTQALKITFRVQEISREMSFTSLLSTVCGYIGNCFPLNPGQPGVHCLGLDVECCLLYLIDVTLKMKKNTVILLPCCSSVKKLWLLQNCKKFDFFFWRICREKGIFWMIYIPWAEGLVRHIFRSSLNLSVCQKMLWREMSRHKSWWSWLMIYDNARYFAHIWTDLNSVSCISIIL